MLVENTFLQPFILIHIAQERYRAAAEIQGLAIFVHHHFHLVWAKQFFLVVKSLDQRGQLRVVTRNQVNQKINLFWVDKRFVALNVDHCIVLCFKYVQCLATPVGATAVHRVGQHILTAET